MISNKQHNKKNIVLLSNGELPKHPISTQILSDSNFIICCDGAANKLKRYNIIPNIIIGDLDSLNHKSINLEKTEIIHIKDQNNNDLRKSLKWITENMDINKLSIVGSTGLRDDHTLGNLASFLYKIYNFEIEILTETGCFYVLNDSRRIQTFPGQYISLFCLNEKQKITTKGLEYELKNASINLYSGTLNIAKHHQISVNISLNTPVLVYLCYENEKN